MPNRFTDNIKLLKERANSRFLLLAIVSACTGLILMLVSTVLESYPIPHTLARETGGILLISGVITLGLDLFGKRALLDEVLAKAQLSRDVDEAGIAMITRSFQSEKLDWASYFRTVRALDIFVSYARGWRNNHLEELRGLARNKDARIRVVLPDPDDPQTLSELARRFDYSDDYLKGLINEAKSEYENLRSPSGARIEVWFLKAAQTFSFYIFDRTAIIALYTHRRERIPVPTLVCDQGGYLYDYLREEFDTVVSRPGLARMVS